MTCADLVRALVPGPVDDVPHEIRRLQMDHQIAVVKAVLGLCIQGNKVILRFTFTWHHTDIVTAHQRIQTGNTRQRGLRRNQPELRFAAQGILHV